MLIKHVIVILFPWLATVVDFEQLKPKDSKRIFLRWLYAKGLMVAIILSDQESTGTAVKHKLAFYLFLIYFPEYPDTNHEICFLKLEYKRKILDRSPWGNTWFPLLKLIFKCSEKLG